MNLWWSILDAKPSSEYEILFASKTSSLLQEYFDEIVHWSESSLGAQPHCLFCHEAAQIRQSDIAVINEKVYKRETDK